MRTAANCSILVADHEPSPCDVIRASLATGGYTLEEVVTVGDAIGLLRRRSFDLILFNINMPDLNGVDVCRTIRAIAPDIGIVMVTDRNVEADKFRGMEAGADDYITKPFRFREFVARVGAVLRRKHGGGAAETVIEVGDLQLDLVRRRLWKRSDEIHLSFKEFELLAYLMKNLGAPIAHGKLLTAVWGSAHCGELEYLRSYIRMLRRKIEDDPAQPFYLKTEPWVGYRFNDAGPAAFHDASECIVETP